ncbi:hypothetical protein [Ghiorsea bivora]|uniref:hypothetical protein n=1 Tax=Ghiorsea bivora TaxID=1485545 RepID=UPI00068BF9EE|nr:hypothetical protein [Ghiorsea bivora]
MMWKISLALILIVGSATFYITSSVYKQSGESTKQRTFFDEKQHLHVMGIVLGESTVRDAELAFRSRTDAALFLYPKETKEGQEAQYTGKLEAYFPSIADHSKVLLTLKITDTALEAIRKRSASPRIYPNGVIRMNLSSQDILAVRRMIITEMSLIPSVQLTEEIIMAQFGKPESVTNTSPNITVYTFPKIGLVATINQDDNDKLTFNNP